MLKLTMGNGDTFEVATHAQAQAYPYVRLEPVEPNLQSIANGLGQLISDLSASHVRQTPTVKRTVSILIAIASEATALAVESKSKDLREP
jgi:hypothetical protein